jgi:Flp pilus assembly protein TadG
MLTRAFIDRAGRACLRRAACGLLPAARPLRRGVRRFAAVLRCRRGVAQIEFALVAIPFMLLLVGTLEIAVMFFTDSVIEGATKEAARQIRTGQVQESADPEAAFRAKLCKELFGIIDCSKVVFNVQTFSSFSSVSMPIEVDEDGNVVSTGFLPGGSSAVTVVRSIYRWNFITPLISQVLPAPLGGHMLVSTVAFQNEPYNVNLNAGGS